MKFQYCSDLHLEFPFNKKYLKANPIKPEGEVLLLAGDIIPFTEIEKENDFLLERKCFDKVFKICSKLDIILKFENLDLEMNPSQLKLL